MAIYYIYMLRCEDNSIYTGITTNLDRRFKEHTNKDNKCAKYTFNHTAKKLEMTWETENRVLASKLEYHIKQLSKKDKEELVKDARLINKLLEDRVDCTKYKLLDKENI